QLSATGHARLSHSFPTRRSSDLHLEGLAAARPALEASISRVAERFGMEWSLHDTARRKRVAIFVSKYDHCLMELLWRTQRGQLRSEEHTSELQSRENLVCRLLLE